MIIVPLIVSSLIVGTASLGDIRQLGRIGGRTLIYFLLTTAVSVTIGMLLANYFQPGAGISPEVRAQLLSQNAPPAAASGASRPIEDSILAVVPTNVINTLAAGDVLPIVFFSLFFGVGLSVLAVNKSEPVIRFMESVNEAVIVMVNFVMKLAPYAVFGIITVVVGRFGFELLLRLFSYALVVLGGLVICQFALFPFCVQVLAGLNPWKFFAKIKGAILTAFGTSSSSVTLPIAIETMEKEFGVSHRVATFVLVLGATVNQNGSALYQAVAALFIAQVYGVSLTFSDQLTIMVTASLSSLGAAGVPGAAVALVGLVLQSVGIPLEGIGLILGVDRFLDMCRTVLNVTGDMSAAAYVARAEGEKLIQ
jgi:Na+/H+-dicarboxylate symporter